MKPNHTENAIIIGAGLSGLAAAQELGARGIPVTILEASDQVATPWRSRHPRLRLNIHRRFARLPGRLNIRAKDTFLCRDSVVEYLTAYAHSLNAQFHFETRVQAVHREGDIWRVETNNGAFLGTQLIVATGRERVKDSPVWPGLDSFAGTVIHAADFADPAQYDNKKVLVIGAGNSGTDVLNHLSRAAPAQVWVSVRHGPSILPSRILGFPLHRLANLFAHLPASLSDPAFAALQRLAFGDLRRFGLRRHPVGGCTRMLKHGVTFALDDGFVAALKSGRFEAVNETVGFSSDAVELRCGREIHPDVVISATGYRPGLENLFGHLGVLDSNGYPLHPMGQADANNPGLWFTGYGVVFQGFFYAAGISARRIADAVTARMSPTQQAASLRALPRSGKRPVLSLTGSEH